MLRIFLAGDKNVIQETLGSAMSLARLGYSFAGEAADGETAMTRIRNTQPDVLITEIRTSSLDGLSLSKQALQEYPRIKVIILSSCEDFPYAQQAIHLGVEGYLLKPVTRSALLSMLEQVWGKILETPTQQKQEFPSQHKASMYEQYVRQRFFEDLVSGHLSPSQLCQRAQMLDIDLQAKCYTIALMSAFPESQSDAESYGEPGARIREGMVALFLKYPEYTHFRLSLSDYAVLIKGDPAQMEGYVQRCIQTVRTLFETYAPQHCWHIAIGTSTQQLASLPEVFTEVSRLWAYRWILPTQNILRPHTVPQFSCPKNALADLDLSLLEPGRITETLQYADVGDVSSFVEEYLRSMGRALDFPPFRQYLVLHIHFTVTRFVQTLPTPWEDFRSGLTCPDIEGWNISFEDLQQYLSHILQQTIALRDSRIDDQRSSPLREAMRYIDVNFHDADISLNRVAQEVDISPNYLSSLFHREMGTTFVEYLTARRMKKARELLRNSPLRSGQIALAVGYRDPRYFSSLFKKIQGCTPLDYRRQKRSSEKTAEREI